MKPPCTRGLKCFEKTNCPQKEFDSEDGTGCPLWIEMEVPTRENPLVKKKYKKCVDLWYFTFQWSMLGLLEGNQQATENFRNAMCEADPVDPLNPNLVRPKADKATMALFHILQEERENRRVIIEHEVKKLLLERDEKALMLDHNHKPDHNV